MDTKNISKEILKKALKIKISFVSLHYQIIQKQFNTTTMKNLFTFAVVLFSSVSIFGQSIDTFQYYLPFIQSNDTIVLKGIQPNEVKVELVEYASNVGVKTEINFINKTQFGDETQLAIYKIAVAEAIEEQNRIVSKLDAFRNKNVQIGGKTPQIERQVTVYVKPNTTLIYAN